MVLDFGGDDITSFLLSLLQRINFPYKEVDLSRWHDWTVLEELKERMVVLSEVRLSPLPLPPSSSRANDTDGRSIS
jgi:actin-related protein